MTYENLFRKINASVKTCSFIKNRDKQRLNNLYSKRVGSTFINVIKKNSNLLLFQCKKDQLKYNFQKAKHIYLIYIKYLY